MKGPQSLSRERSAAIERARAPVVGIRLEHKSESKNRPATSRCHRSRRSDRRGSCRLLYSREARAGLRFTRPPVGNSVLRGRCSYFAVVNRLGPPADDKWRTSSGELQFRKLSYPKLGLNVILAWAATVTTRFTSANSIRMGVSFIRRIPNTEKSLLRQLRKF